jgi:hypothetical protein
MLVRTAPAVTMTAARSCMRATVTSDGSFLWRRRGTHR